jgi:hypothetical protein
MLFMRALSLNLIASARCAGNFFNPSSLIHASAGEPPTAALINPIGTLYRL